MVLSQTEEPKSGIALCLALVWRKECVKSDTFTWPWVYRLIFWLSLDILLYRHEQSEVEKRGSIVAFDWIWWQKGLFYVKEKLQTTEGTMIY